MVITDCKALYDTLRRENLQSAGDKQVAIECLVIRDSLDELGAQLRWVSSERQMADGLTKVSARQSLIEPLNGGFIKLIHDPELKAAKKKSVPERQQARVSSTSRVAQSVSMMVASEMLHGLTGDHFFEYALTVVIILFSLFCYVTGRALEQLVRWCVRDMSKTESCEKSTETPDEWDREKWLDDECVRLEFELGEQVEKLRWRNVT